MARESHYCQGTAGRDGVTCCDRSAETRWVVTFESDGVKLTLAFWLCGTHIRMYRKRGATMEMVES